MFVKEGHGTQGATAARSLPRRQAAEPTPDAASGHGRIPFAGFSTPRLTWGLMNKTMERHDVAIQHFTALLGDPSAEVFALTMIGESHEAMGTTAQEATRCTRDATQEPRAPARSRPRSSTSSSANLFYNTGDRAEALYYFERVSKRDPTFRDVQRRLAALKSRGAPTRAIYRPTTCAASWFPHAGDASGRFPYWSFTFPVVA